MVQGAGQLRLNHQSDFLLELVLGGKGGVVDRGRWDLQLLLLLELLELLHLVWGVILDSRGRWRSGLT